MQLRRVDPVLAGAALVLLALWVVGQPRPAFSSLQLAPAVTLVVLATLAPALLGGWRWSLLSGLRLRTCLRWNGEAAFLSVAVTGELGGDGYRVDRATRLIGKSSAAASVAVDRTLPVLTSGLLAVPFAVHCAVTSLGTPTTLAAGGLACGLAYHFCRERLARFTAALRTVAAPRQVALAVATTVAAIAALTGDLLLAAATVGVPLSVAQAALLAPGVALAGRLPSPCGLGLTHAVVFAVLLAAGGSAAQAGVAAALFAFVTLGAALLGGLLLLLHSGLRPWQGLAIPDGPALAGPAPAGTGLAGAGPVAAGRAAPERPVRPRSRPGIPG